MPIMSCTLPHGGSGFKWGEHGHCYPTRAAAERQAAAAHASGYVGDAARKQRTLKAVRPNAGVQAEYRRRLDALVDEMNNSITYWLTATYREQLPAIAADASPVKALLTTLRDLSKRWLRRFEIGAQKLAEWHAQKTRSYTDTALHTALKDAGFSVKFTMTPAMQTAYDAVIAEQVGLIKSIAQQNLQQVETLVMQSVQTGRDLGQLAPELEKRYGITKRRAALIARDQNNKATATLTRHRQQELGITHAVWLHSHGGKTPRPSHVKADGETYEIAKGMFLDGEWVFPGELINCRCVSRSVIPDVF